MPITLPIALAAASLAVTVVGTVKGMQEDKKQSALAQQGIQVQQQADQIREAREVRSTVRETRIRAAAATQAAADQGASTSSAAQGGVASLGSQLTSNLSFLDQMGSLNEDLTNINGRINKSRSKSSTYGAVTQVGGTIFGAAGGFRTIFDGGKTTGPLQGAGKNGVPIG